MKNCQRFGEKLFCVTGFVSRDGCHVLVLTVGSVRPHHENQIHFQNIWKSVIKSEDGSKAKGKVDTKDGRLNKIMTTIQPINFVISFAKLVTII